MPIPMPGRIAEALRRSTIQVRSGRGRSSGGGSGVMLGEGRVVTNAHVIQAEPVTVEGEDGKRVSARCLRVDRRRDLALLSAPELQGTTAPLGDSDRLRAGTPVFAVGNPLGFVGAVSSGVVHGVSSLGGLAWIQADLRLAPGSSGGPMADLQGYVVGINTMVMSGGLGLAVPSRAVQSLIARAKSGRSLGVTVRPVELQSGKLGIIILEVSTGGAAASASLLAGDILTGANGRIFRSLDDLQYAIDTASGSLLHLDFFRGGQTKARQVAVRLAPEQVASSQRSPVATSAA
jgi:serine protease Do